MKKIIQYTALIALIATAVISCSSDSSQGMLRSIVDSQEEVSYSIKKSSFNEDDEYFVSVENDGIWKASYTDAADNVDNNILNNVERKFYSNSGTDNITSVLDIYTEGKDSYILTVDVSVDGNNETITTPTLKYFDNNFLNSSFDADDANISLTEINGTVKNLTENGYLISVDNDTTPGESHIYLYKINPSTKELSLVTTTAFSLLNFFNSDYDSSRYNNYALVKKDTFDVTNRKPDIDGFIISLTDDDNTIGEYHADNDYYYVPLAGGECIELKITDSDEDGESEPIVAASMIGTTYILLAQDGDCYYGAISSTMTESWNNKNNSDAFANHLPTLTYVADEGYLIAMDSYDHIYIYEANTDDRTSTVSETVAYATTLNNASDIIYIQYISTDTSDIDKYWVATINNGYYTIYIDSTKVAEESGSHVTDDGFVK
jgi:hypothetical protein